MLKPISTRDDSRVGQVSLLGSFLLGPFRSGRPRCRSRTASSRRASRRSSAASSHRRCSQASASGRSTTAERARQRDDRNNVRAGAGAAPCHPHLRRDRAPPVTSLPGLGSPHATSAPGLGSPVVHLPVQRVDCFGCCGGAFWSRAVSSRRPGHDPDPSLKPPCCHWSRVQALVLADLALTLCSARFLMLVYGAARKAAWPGASECEYAG